MRKPYHDVVAAVPVTIPYVRYSTRSAHWWIARALEALLQESGFSKDTIDGFCVSSFTLAPDTAVGLAQQLGVSPRWLDHIPMGGACGLVALRRAARAVQAGDADVVACIAGDTNHIDTFRLNLGSFSQFARDATYPYGAGGPNATFALLTSYYMREYGFSREDFGKLCLAFRENALKFSGALMTRPLTMDEYLGSRVICEPLGLYDCVMPCAGADAFLVLGRERAEDAGIPYARILGTIERTNAFPEDPIQARGGWARDCAELYAMSGLGPDDMDFVQLYDDYPVVVVQQLEDCGFCPKGECRDFVRQHTFEAGGSFPINTSGGQLSVGQAGAAGGYLGLVEAIRQLSGRPHGAAVDDAAAGFVSGFGMVSYDRGLCTSAAILASGSA